MASSSDRDNDQFRPRIGGKRGQIKPQRVPTFRRSVLARMHQRFVRLASGGEGTSQRGGARTSVGPDVREPPAYARRCVVKARIVPMNDRGVAAARLHLDYIERDGVERDGSKGELYGAGPSIDRDVLRTAVPEEKHQFRFIVSPEDAGDLDLKLFTRALMNQVERDLGRRLIWGAVNHHDTDNPHVHVVVRGVDAGGRAVRIDREYISRRMRWRAQEIVTRELGPRSPSELDRQRDREIRQERLTALDGELERLSSGGGSVDMGDLSTVSNPRHRARLLGRLQMLEGLGLVRRRAPGSWAFEDGWHGALRKLGERGDIIKRIHSALPGPGDGARYRVIDGTSEQRPVEGVLRRKGLHDELRGDMYAVVEDARGQAHYVRADALTLAQIEDGAVVRVSAKRDTWAKGMDTAIASFAALADGVYDPAAHLATLQRQPLIIRGERVDASAVIAANQRRLERLVRYGLVGRLAGGRWRVPADLVAQLKAREKSHPRVRVVVDRIAPPLAQQVASTGPAWVDSAFIGAAYGFAAEVHAARTARASRERDRAPSAPGSGLPPRDLRAEARAAGEQLARARGLRFVADPPSGHRGVLVELGEAGRAGSVAVVDERARTVTVVSRALVPPGDAARAVEILRDAGGGIVVRQRDLAKDA
jgi:type IV secretory pathway VirD2 relaxase